jgi:hypothetical protein
VWSQSSTAKSVFKTKTLNIVIQFWFATRRKQSENKNEVN